MLIFEWTPHQRQYYGAVKVSLAAAWNPTFAYRFLQYAESSTQFCVQNRVDFSYLYSWMLCTYTHKCVNTYIQTYTHCIHAFWLTFATFCTDLKYSQCARKKLQRETQLQHYDIAWSCVPHGTLIFYSVHSTWFEHENCQVDFQNHL